MSGAICQDCGSPWLKSSTDKSIGEQPVECEYCGWTGDASGLPRKKLTIESHRNWSARMEKKRAGKLFVLRITVDKTDMDTTFEIMSVLSLDSLNYKSGQGRTSITVELDSRPSDQTLEELRAIKGVLEARLV